MARMADLSFLSVVPQIKTPLALAGLAIAALVQLVQTRRGRGRDPATLVAVFAVVALGLVPLVFDGVARLRANEEIYRVRVIARGSAGMPLDGVTISTDVLNEAKSTDHGTTELAVPRGSLPKGSSITIYAAAEGLKGTARIVLDDDLNPTAVIDLVPDQSAAIAGVVLDRKGHGIPDVAITAGPGISTRTDGNGAFRLSKLGAEGEQIRLRFEHNGLDPVDDFYSAGDEQVRVAMSQ